MYFYDENKTIRELRAKFYETVRSHIKDALREANEDDSDNPVWGSVEQLLRNERETIDEWLSREADSLVTYTADAETIVFVADSRHADAYEDETGEKAPTVEAQAAWAYIAACNDLLGNEYFLRDMAEELFGAKESA